MAMPITALRMRSAASGTPTDPDWTSVLSLLNAVGADGSTTITDEKGLIWTPSGNAQIDTSLGYNSILLDGNDLISTPHASGWNITQVWTIELWIYALSVTGFQNLMGKRTGANFAPFTFALDGNKTRMRFGNGALNAWDIDNTGTINVATGVLTHIAFCHEIGGGGTVRQYVNGVQAGSAGYSGIAPTNASDVYIGAQSDSAGGYNGHIVAQRTTPGVCRYPSGTTFTPPTPPLPTS
jgi:hypothetical protein